MRTPSVLRSSPAVRALAIGALGTSVLLAVAVAVQSGVPVAVVSWTANVVMLAPSVAIGATLARVFERRAQSGQAWWVARAQAYVATFIVLMSILALPLSSVSGEMRAAPGLEQVTDVEFAAAIVGGLAFAYGTPLLTALGFEAWLRRRAARAEPTDAP